MTARLYQSARAACVLALPVGSSSSIHPTFAVLRGSCTSEACVHAARVPFASALSLSALFPSFGAVAAVLILRLCFRLSEGLHCRGECSGCHQAWALAFAPRIVHERSAVIGVLTQVRHTVSEQSAYRAHSRALCKKTHQSQQSGIGGTGGWVHACGPAAEPLCRPVRLLLGSSCIAVRKLSHTGPVLSCCKQWVCSLSSCVKCVFLCKSFWNYGCADNVQHEAH